MEFEKPPVVFNGSISSEETEAHEMGLTQYSQLVNNRVWNARQRAQSRVCVCLSVRFLVLTLLALSCPCFYQFTFSTLSLIYLYLSISWISAVTAPHPPTHTWTILIASFLVPASVFVSFLTVSPPALPPLTLEDRAHCPPHGIQKFSTLICLLYPFPFWPDPLLWPNQITHWIPKVIT